MLSLNIFTGYWLNTWKAMGTGSQVPYEQNVPWREGPWESFLWRKEGIAFPIQTLHEGLRGRNLSPFQLCSSDFLWAPLGERRRNGCCVCYPKNPFHLFDPLACSHHQPHPLPRVACGGEGTGLSLLSSQGMPRYFGARSVLGQRAAPIQWYSCWGRAVTREGVGLDLARRKRSGSQNWLVGSHKTLSGELQKQLEERSKELDSCLSSMDRLLPEVWMLVRPPMYPYAGEVAAHSDFSTGLLPCLLLALGAHSFMKHASN